MFTLKKILPLYTDKAEQFKRKQTQTQLYVDSLSVTIESNGNGMKKNSKHLQIRLQFLKVDSVL